MNKLTKRDLIEKGIDALDPAELNVPVEHDPDKGAVSSINLPQVVEVAKLMAATGEALPEHCRANPGMCLRIVFQAVEWRMSPFSVADMSYIVKGRLAYMSQLLHAVIEGRAPLQRRLSCEYEGEYVYDEYEAKDQETGETFTRKKLNPGKSTRSCTVIGHFINGDMREYKTPPFNQIKVKNSPLWLDDPDQQLFYFGSRSWARKWCPDILLGCYTREEAQQMDPLNAPAIGLGKRLPGRQDGDEGFKGQQFINGELDQVAGPAAGRAIKQERQKFTKPTNLKTWRAYCRERLALFDDADQVKQWWKSERGLRNGLGITAEERKKTEEAMRARIKELEE